MKLLRSFLVSVAVALAAWVPAVAQTMVRLHTTMGPIDVKLLDADAPVTVANFLAYVREGDYTDVFFHRSAGLSNPQVPSIIQAGGFKWHANTSCCSAAPGSPNLVPSKGAIVNESSPLRSNVQGTIAMARTSDPNSASSQWYINVHSNTFLDTPPGYAVFGYVTAPGMAVASSIGALPRLHGSSPFNDLPLQGWQTGQSISRANFVRITAATEFPAQPSSVDRIFNYLEAAYPPYVSSAPDAAGEGLGFLYRYYAGTDSYLGVKDGRVWFYAPALMHDVMDIGAQADWLATAQGAGY